MDTTDNNTAAALTLPDEAIDAIFGGHCVLFLGSGFSLKAKNATGNELPGVGGLKKILERETGLEAEDLEQAAEDYIAVKGEYNLAPLLSLLFKATEVTDSHREIAADSWKRVYTTNYDDVFEVASAAHKRVLTPVTPSQNVRDYNDKSDIVVHINGSLDNLLSDSLTQEFKLTTSSYDVGSEFVKSEWGSLFKYDLKDADAIFFIGFSLDHDIDLRRLIVEQSVKDKTYFIVSPHESEAKVRKLSRYGHVYPIGVDEFARQMQSRRRSQVPVPMRLERPLLCFRTVAEGGARPSINDRIVTDLLLRGIVDRDAIRYCLREGQETDYLYYIRRREPMARILNLIDRGTKNIAVHSDLGNGKTLFIDGLAMTLEEHGYKVFIFDRERASLDRELEQICNRPDKRVVFIIENYGRYSDLLKRLTCFRSDQILIVTERSAIHELRYSALEEIIGGEIAEIDINKMSADDRADLIRIFDNAGLWRHLAAHHGERKDEYIRTECRNSLRGLLLGLLKSPHILDRFKSLITTMQQKNDFYETVVLVMLNSLFSLNLNLDMIETALDTSVSNNGRFIRNENVKELIDIGGGEIKVKSALMAEALLGKVINKETIKNVLVKMFRNFDPQSGNSDYRRVLQIVILYTNLRRALNSDEPGTDFTEMIVRFFEEIRDTRFCKNNPHYWLQYAILTLDRQDLDLAQIYFETSYSLAKRKPDYDTYQIDNHFARYLLERGSSVDKDAPYMDYFNKAHRILTDRNHQKDTKYYPFKMAQLYEPFYEAHASHISDKDSAIIARSAEEILNMMGAYLRRVPEHRTHPAVKDAERSLKRILDNITRR